MSARAFHLVIDARPRGMRGPLAAEVVLGKSVLDHLLEMADELAPAAEPVVIHAREDEHWPAARAGRPARFGAACSSCAGRRVPMRRFCEPIAFTMPGGSSAGCGAGRRRKRQCSGGWTGRKRWLSPTKS